MDHPCINIVCVCLNKAILKKTYFYNYIHTHIIHVAVLASDERKWGLEMAGPIGVRRPLTVKTGKKLIMQHIRVPDPDPALNFPSSGSRQKFRIHADPDPDSTHVH